LKVVWSKALNSRGLAGIAATRKHVLVADRTASDSGDLFRCLDAATGEDLWQLEYATTGTTKDYGNVPRATPLIRGDKVFTLGCLGNLHCLDLSSGKVVWAKHLARDFGARVPTWGYCSSPLAVDGNLIVNPGAKKAAVVAIDCETGKVIWQSIGLPPAYGSFVVGTFGGVRQIVGYDEKSLGGWDPATGKRLWTMVPPLHGDFNVPTPIDADGKLVMATENNGTRLYDFDGNGVIKTVPVASNSDLVPDSSTPVLVGDKLFGCSGSLYCLDISKRLAARWNGEDDALAGYACAIASDRRVLVVTNHGELLLVDAEADRFTIVSRLRVFPADSEVLSHPAIVGNRIYLRDMTRIVCVDLGSAEE
jgi:outer membrane protein assembly factor BamB